MIRIEMIRKISMNEIFILHRKLRFELTHEDYIHDLFSLMFYELDDLVLDQINVIIGRLNFLVAKSNFSVH